MFASTPAVIDGIETGGTFADRPRNAHHGAGYYASDLQRSLHYDSLLNLWVPDDGKLLLVTAENYYVDCFRGAALDNAYSTGKGNDAQAALGVLDTDQQGGELDMVTGDAGTGTAADATSLAPTIAFDITAATKATRLGTRVKLSAITDVAAYIGLTDVLPASVLELPISLSGTTFTTTATDAGGLLFDTAATTDTIRGIGVDDDNDTTQLDTALAYVADTYVDLLLLITPAGVASVYIDQALIGTFVVSTNADLYPILFAEARSTASRTLSAKYFFCHQDG